MAESVLVVEDDRELREFLVEVLETAGYAVNVAGAAEPAVRELEQRSDIDLVLSDMVLPGSDGETLLTWAREHRPELHVVIMTAFGSIDSAIRLVRQGAFDYLTKPLRTAELLVAVDRALTDSRARRVDARLARVVGEEPPRGFIGTSAAMREVYRLIGRAARVPHPVLITGESGTGKELVARALHQASERAAFVAVNCGALPENLLESELFGHVKGAFTGADRAKQGLFEVAHGGTVFLDEIGELPLTLQPKLLRALELSEIRPVGAVEDRSVDIRVIAATNRELEEAVAQGRFRDDLFWRLNVLQIHVPPLRERRADIPGLAKHFLQRAVEASGANRAGPASIAPDAMSMLTAYPWPGNVRELRNVMQRAATLGTGPAVRPEDLSVRIRESGQVASLVEAASQRQLSLRDVERLYILEVLRQTGGNRSRAAEVLGLDRKTLYRRLEEYRAEQPTLD